MCPLVQRRFHASVNMSPAEIRRWAQDPRSREFSFEATRRRLPALAKLKGKALSAWNGRDCRYAKRVISFNARMGGGAEKNGCTRGRAISLRNWGRRQCPV